MRQHFYRQKTPMAKTVSSDFILVKQWFCIFSLKDDNPRLHHKQACSLDANADYQGKRYRGFWVLVDAIAAHQGPNSEVRSEFSATGLILKKKR